jgi:hypothetical protein
MLENCNNFTANNISENSASRADQDWVVRGGGGFPLVIWQGELVKGVGSSSCGQLLSPNYIDNYVHFGIVMQFVKYSSFYLIKFNYIHFFVVYINTFGQCIFQSKNECVLYIYLSSCCVSSLQIIVYFYLF